MPVIEPGQEQALTTKATLPLKMSSRKILCAGIVFLGSYG